MFNAITTNVTNLLIKANSLRFVTLTDGATTDDYDTDKGLGSLISESIGGLLSTILKEAAVPAGIVTIICIILLIMSFFVSSLKSKRVTIIIVLVIAAILAAGGIYTLVGSIDNVIDGAIPDMTS